MATQNQYIKFRDALFDRVKPSKPTIIVMVGGPGSGKSSARKKSIHSMRFRASDFVVIDPDEIVTKVFGNDYSQYWIDSLDHDNPETSHKLDVVMMNNMNFQYAIGNRYNIVFDGTGRNVEFTRSNVIENARTHGYRVVVCVNILDASEALKRSEERGTLTGRKVDTDYLTGVYDTLFTVILEYLQMGCSVVDIIQVYDNTDDMVMVVERIGNEVTSRSKCKANMCRKLNVVGTMDSSSVVETNS